ncbi:hypothetical protein DBV15_05220, partial [Temnothorax longispinosus]
MFSPVGVREEVNERRRTRRTKENGRRMSNGGLATSLASPGQGARAFCSGRKARRGGGERRGNRMSLPMNIDATKSKNRIFYILVTSGSRHEMYKIGRPTAGRTVALVAKVPKSGRSCNTLRDSLKAAREEKKRTRKRPREKLCEVRFWECGCAAHLPKRRATCLSLLSGPGLRSSFRPGFNSGLVAEAIDSLRRAKGDTLPIKKGAEKRKKRGERARAGEKKFFRGQWTRHPCPDLTLRTDNNRLGIRDFKEATELFFQADFFRRAGGDDGMKRISRVASYASKGSQRKQADANFIISEEEPATVEEPAPEPTEKLSRCESTEIFVPKSCKLPECPDKLSSNVTTERAFSCPGPFSPSPFALLR